MKLFNARTNSVYKLELKLASFCSGNADGSGNGSRSSDL